MSGVRFPGLKFLKNIVSITAMGRSMNVVWCNLRIAMGAYLHSGFSCTIDSSVRHRGFYAIGRLALFGGLSLYWHWLNELSRLGLEYTASR